VKPDNLKEFTNSLTGFVNSAFEINKREPGNLLTCKINFNEKREL